MRKRIRTLPLILILILAGILMSFSKIVSAQSDQPYMRIAQIVIDSLQLDNYKAALKEHAETAIKKEPGVLTLYAVYNKDQPTQVTVFEIYTSLPAYQSHIQTPHFLSYKATVIDMVKSLILTDVVPIALEAKPK